MEGFVKDPNQRLTSWMQTVNSVHILGSSANVDPPQRSAAALVAGLFLGAGFAGGVDRDVNHDSFPMNLIVQFAGCNSGSCWTFKLQLVQIEAVLQLQ